MKAFRLKRGSYVAEIDRTERTVLLRVVADTAWLLGTRLDVQPEPDDRLARLSWSADTVAEPTDPALARLLPNASDDEEIAGEFRRLTESDLRTIKVERLRMMWTALQLPGERLEVAAHHAMDWAAALNDVRLVLAERLEIVTEEDAEGIYQAAQSGGDDVDAALASLYLFLTWLHESLMMAMLKAL
ncbi:MAG: DUF2017 domain-containing protein [Beutenbergiaceae bacterium]